MVFERRRKPIKIGIHHDINAALAGTVTPDELSLALRLYCSNICYQYALTRTAVRIDLEGAPSGTVTETDVAQATKSITAHKARLVARKAAREAAQSPPATPSPPLKRLTFADLREAGRLRKQKAAEQQSAGAS